MTTKPTATELVEALATLDVHNAANGTHLKIEQPDPWEVQGFIDGYAEGRAAWSTVVDGPTGVLTYLAEALDSPDTSAFVVRRSSGAEVEHVRLVDGGARERLARHLWLIDAGSGNANLAIWTCHGIDRTAWLDKADEILAVIADGEG